MLLGAVERMAGREWIRGAGTCGGTSSSGWRVRRHGPRVAVAVLRGVRTSSCVVECSNACGHGKVASVQGSRASRSVWAIAGASAAVQAVVGSLHRAPSWDEAIYLSQVTRGAVALPFVASRARGITVLVAPLASLGAPLWLVRLALVVGSSLL